MLLKHDMERPQLNIHHQNSKDKGYIKITLLLMNLSTPMTTI